VPKLIVIANEFDGWDVVREQDGTALSNHPTRDSAIRAARMRAAEEHLDAKGGDPVTVAERGVHPIDDARQGVKPAFLALSAILLFVTLLVALLSLTGALTGFGS
jgi:Uncharacterized protein conserved in bacteria (DUF2188)